MARAQREQTAGADRIIDWGGLGIEQHAQHFVTPDEAVGYGQSPGHGGTHPGFGDLEPVECAVNLLHRMGEGRDQCQSGHTRRMSLSQSQRHRAAH